MRKITLGTFVAIAIAIMSQGTTFAATQEVTVAAVRQFTPTAVTIENEIPETPDLSNQDDEQGDD
jgi:hypothetical protein